MSKVITFSTKFQSTHPKKGKPTYFVEKIWKSLQGIGFSEPQYFFQEYPQLMDVMVKPVWEICDPKHHTIRRGKRWKAGDSFSPRIWTDKPYSSKQIIIAPDIKLQRVSDFDMDDNGVFSIDGKYIDRDDYLFLAKNDGLIESDMLDWLMPDYNKPVSFSGQILIWNNNNLPY